MSKCSQNNLVESFTAKPICLAETIFDKDINHFCEPNMTQRIKQTAKLNHLSFPTKHIHETAAFFQKYLGCEVVAVGEACLLKRHDFDIVLDPAGEEMPLWPSHFHFGLELETLDDVHALYNEFKDDGVHMESEVFNNTRGSRFFCRAPGGVLIEINTRQDMEIKENWRKLF